VVSLTSSSGGYINGRNSANLELLIDKTMGTNCAPLLADLFLYSYESEFLQKLVKGKKIHEARAFNFTFRYIDDVVSLIINFSTELTTVVKFEVLVQK
jgi:hypothetical protein